MRTRKWRAAACAGLLCNLAVSVASAASDPPQAGRMRVQDALASVAALDRPGEIGLATFWDGNKYTQCRRVSDHTLHCEAAGAAMQSSLGHVLTQERIARLNALGWGLDQSFGNYARIFPADLPSNQVADAIVQALVEGYDADLPNLQAQTDWIKDEPCPPRHGPSQNLAGMISDARSMAANAIHACAYTPPAAAAIGSAADLIALYGTRVTGEILRLRVNIDRRVYLILQTDVGYIQCAPKTGPDEIYCEAQSADSWPALASVLTAERIARLHTAGFADPGRAPNYWRTYPLGEFDAAAVSRAALTILYDVYGYSGEPKLGIATEKGD
jgi:hypothetical protein